MNRARLQLGRHSVIGQSYILTTNTVARSRCFDDGIAAQRVMQEFQRLDVEGFSDSLAYVVMPDHIHWLLELRASSLEHVMRRFKSRSAIQVNRVLGRGGRLWQPSYHDHAIRSDESLFRHAQYVMANPVRAGLTMQLGQYPHAWCRWEMEG